MKADAEMDIKCEFIDCDYITNSKLLLRRHTFEHIERESTTHTTTNTSTNSSYCKKLIIPCTEEGCEFSSRNALQVQLHLKKHVAKCKFKCEHCHQLTSANFEMVRHVERVHGVALNLIAFISNTSNEQQQSGLLTTPDVSSRRCDNLPSNPNLNVKTMSYMICKPKRKIKQKCEYSNCNFMSINQSEFEFHTFNYHQKTTMKVPTYSFDYLDKDLQHEFKMRRDPTHECPWRNCMYVGRQRSHVDAHEKLHDMGISCCSYMCKICFQLFRNTNVAATHLRRSHDQILNKKAYFCVQKLNSFEECPSGNDKSSKITCSELSSSPLLFSNLKRITFSRKRLNDRVKTFKCEVNGCGYNSSVLINFKNHTKFDHLQSGREDIVIRSRIRKSNSARITPSDQNDNSSMTPLRLPLYQCDICFANYSFFQYALHHVKHIHTTTNSVAFITQKINWKHEHAGTSRRFNYSCEYSNCCFKTCSWNSFQTHTLRHLNCTYQDILNKFNPTNPNSTSKSLKCCKLDCKYVARNEDNLRNHSQQHDVIDLKLQCVICNALFNSNTDNVTYTHMRVVHGLYQNQDAFIADEFVGNTRASYILRRKKKKTQNSNNINLRLRGDYDVMHNFMCKACRRVTSKKHQLETHIRKCHQQIAARKIHHFIQRIPLLSRNDKQNHADLNKYNTAQKCFQCNFPNCYFSTIYRDVFKNHTKGLHLHTISSKNKEDWKTATTVRSTINNKRLMCDICHEGFTTITNVHRHIRRLHTSLNVPAFVSYVPVTSSTKKTSENSVTQKNNKSSNLMTYRDGSCQNNKSLLLRQDNPVVLLAEDSQPSSSLPGSGGTLASSAPLESINKVFKCVACHECYNYKTLLLLHLETVHRELYLSFLAKVIDTC